MSVQKVAVDDNDASVVYYGQWTAQSSSGAYGGSLHVSTSAGSSASLSFTGISVNIVGTIPPCTVTGAPVTYQVVLDGSPVDWGTHACSTSTQNSVLLYSTSSLSNAAHKITIIDETNESPSLMLDLFAYVAESQGTTTAGSVTSGGTSSATSTTFVGDGGSTSSTTNGASYTSSTAQGSGSTVAPSSTALAGKVVAVSQVSLTNSVSTVSSSLAGLSAPTNLSNSNSSSSLPGSSNASSHSIGPIIGGILAAVLVLFLLFLRLWLYYRRRKRGINGLQQNNSSEIVMPFHLDPESFLAGASLISSIQQDAGGSGSAGSELLSGEMQEKESVRNNGPLQRSMPTNISPFILDERKVESDAGARPTSVLGLGNVIPPPAEKRGQQTLGEDLSSQLLASRPLPRSSQKRSSYPSGDARSSTLPTSDTVPAYMTDHTRSSLSASAVTALSAPSNADSVPAYMRDPDREDSSSRDGLHPYHHHHSGISHLSNATGAASQLSEMPPAYHECCALPRAAH